LEIRDFAIFEEKTNFIHDCPGFSDVAELKTKTEIQLACRTSSSQILLALGKC